MIEVREYDSRSPATTARFYLVIDGREFRTPGVLVTTRRRGIVSAGNVTFFDITFHDKDLVSRIAN